MITSTKKVLALATLIVTTGVAGVELGRDTAQPVTRDEAHVAARIDTAFDLVAASPETPAVKIPMAMKGDLPVPRGCLGVQGDAQAECMDAAYELPAEPSIVVETREGNTTTLMRVDAMALANLTDGEVQLQSE